MSIGPDRVREDPTPDVTRLLNDAAFTLIVATATTLLLRVQLRIDQELERYDQHAGHDKPDLPRELADRDWLDRAERIARFIAEMAGARERIRHVSRLNDDHERKNADTGESRPVAKMGKGQTETRGRQAASANGRRRV